MMKKIPFPTTVDLALTGKCNLRCKHCNTSGTWNLENELSFKEILNVLDELKKEKIFNLSLFGGEPFCYDRIFELFEALNDYPVRVTILTNGTMIDGTAVRYLKKMRFLEVVQISVDGSSSAVHDWQRGEGSFQKSLEAVKLLIENGLPVRIKAVINAHNYTDIGNMAGLALDLGLGGMDFGDAVECGRAAAFADDLRFSGQIHRVIMETVFALKKKHPDFNIGGTLGQKMEMLTDLYENGPGMGDRGTFSTCPAGQNMLSIRSDGKVVPCSAFWTMVCGDIRESSLSDIWNDSGVLNDIRALADEPLTESSAECDKCDYLTYCNGGCRAAAYYTSGRDLRGIDRANCLVFSGLHGYRVSKETVLSQQS
ncbi:MAG: radical SAM protein [Candidatus Omnitrophica bacterium]|nr:radical SAM protein [Candidatus Omnitrophota bacterium]